ncbi:MAG: substrate-binding domain-containing protein [Chloroflexota bacterium]|nr:substrate-binding domain-containing protein [Chloroflexota bacterium]
MSNNAKRWSSILASLMLVLMALPAAGTTSYAQGGSQTFPETGKTVKGRFLEYWQQNGGLPQQGYPITEEMQEKSDTDGKTYTVQYFERAVFEAHPENQKPYDVLLSLLGVFQYKATYGTAGAPGQKASTAAGARKFAETGKTVGGKFLDYWNKNGGLAQQGYPLTEEFTEVSALNGKPYTVQYFERAVFELHPENQAPFDVLLSQLGTFRLKQKQAAAKGPINVGLLTDKSGSLAIYGPMLERGFELGLEYATGGTNKVYGRDIKVTTKDTASNVETGTSLAREAIEKDKAQILVGVPSSGVALAVSAVANDNKVVYLAGPAASPDITGKNFNRYTFRAGRSSVHDALTMGSALTGMGKKFIQIAPDYAFGRGSAAAFYNVIKAKGGTFVVNDNTTDFGTVFAPQDTTDFTPYLNQILDSGADVLVVTWAGTGFVPLFQQMQQLGIFDSMVVATGMGDNQTLAKGYADAIGSVGVSVYHYSLFDTPVNNWLVEKHRAKYNTPPDLFTESGFIAAQMLVNALVSNNGEADAEGLIKALEGMTFEGPKGTYTSRPEDHDLLQPMTLVKLKNTTDKDFRFFELVKAFKPEETAPPCSVPAAMNRCK